MFLVQYVHPIVILLKIILCQKIFAVNLTVVVFVQLVRRRFVVKIQLYKSIELAMQIFLDNVVINFIALRVGENIG